MYNPANWYWNIDGDETRAYSSAVAGYVPADNEAFMAWKEAGNAATQIDSEESLEVVLARQFPAGWPGTAIKKELATLDPLLPRALENYWEATKFDTTKLHAVQLAILNQKKALRQQLQNL